MFFTEGKKTSKGENIESTTQLKTGRQEDVLTDVVQLKPIASVTMPPSTGPVNELKTRIGQHEIM